MCVVSLLISYGIVFSKLLNILNIVNFRVGELREGLMILRVSKLDGEHILLVYWKVAGFISEICY